MPAGPELPADALLDALFAEAPVGLAFWDAGLRFRRINPELAAINGVPVEDHLGRRPSEVLPELGPLLEDTFRSVLASGEPLRDLDLVGETPSAPGVTRHWLASYFPVSDGGRLSGLVGIVLEVTGERQAQARSASVDAELRALVAASPLGVGFLDRDLRYQRVNDTLARMNGRPVDEHIGRTIEEILGPVAAILDEPLRQVIEKREPLEFEATVALPSDPSVMRTFEATYFPVVDAGGTMLGIGAVVRDATQRHELEEEQSRLLRQALLARATSEAAEVRADDAREEAEIARAEAERARRRIALLSRIGREMAQSLDWEATLRAVVRIAVPQIADWCALTIVERNGRLRVVAIAHEDPERERLGWELVTRYPTDPAAPVGQAKVVRTGEIEVVEDIPPSLVAAAARDEDHRRLLESLDVRHSVIAPLRTPGGVIGTISFLLGDSGRRFSADDVSLISSVAARAALHIQNARLYRERSHIAQTLQASLRPRALPEIPGAAIAARFLAAGDQNEVGGDFYDVFPTGDRVWTAIVGDVSGKGAEAAAVTALARHTLRTASLLHDDPAANLALLDRVMAADSLMKDFCTVFYTRVCPAEGGALDLRYANGGHPPPLVLRAGGTVEALTEGRGPLVGGIAGAAFAEGTLRLQPGDLLLMYTDGVTETRVSDADFGEADLRATVAAHAGGSADELVDAVLTRAVELQGGVPRDDIALVAIRAGATVSM